MAMTVETSLLNNQNILQNFGLVEEINEQAAEIISGGSERFLIKNSTQNAITYSVDGLTQTIKPGQEMRIATPFGGKVTFDRDIREDKVEARRYDLSDGKRYIFLNEQKNSNSINLYRVS